MPGKLQLFFKASTSGVITPKSSAMIGTSPKYSLILSNKSFPGPLTHLPTRAFVAMPDTSQ